MLSCSKQTLQVSSFKRHFLIGGMHPLVTTITFPIHTDTLTLLKTFDSRHHDRRNRFGIDFKYTRVGLATIVQLNRSLRFTNCKVSSHRGLHWNGDANPKARHSNFEFSEWSPRSGLYGCEWGGATRIVLS